MSKSRFSPEKVVHIAALVKLLLTKAEASKFALEMTSTLDYIHNLEELDTKTVEPTYQVTGITNRFQNEVTNERALPKTKVFLNVHGTKQGYFQIKGMDYRK